METIELNRRLGEIARQDVFLEHQLRHLWLTLVAPSLAQHVVPNDGLRLVEDCRLMIEHLSLGPEKVDAAKSALTDARDAHEGRNRVLHDMWFRPGEDSEWTLNRNPRRGVEGGKGRTVTVEEIESVRAHIDRAVRRIVSLAWAVRSHLPYFVNGGMAEPQSDDDSWAFVAGDFDIQADGGAVLRRR